MKNHVLFNFGMMLFFAGVGLAICAAIHHAFGEPSIIPGVNIPLVMGVPTGLIFFFIAVKFAIPPLYNSYRQKVSTMRQNYIITTEYEQYLLEQAMLFKKNCLIWIFATSWLIFPLICYMVAYVFFYFWVANIQTTPK